MSKQQDTNGSNQEPNVTDYKALVDQVNRETLERLNNPQDDEVQPEDYPEIKPGARGKIIVLETINNLKHLFKIKKIIIRYNLMTRRIEIDMPGVIAPSDDKDNYLYTAIENVCILNNFPISSGGKRLYDKVMYIAQEQSYHPIRDLITAKPWDGTERVKDFIKTIPTSPDKADFVAVMITKWMTSVMAAAFSDKGFSCHGVLVLQGDQDLGKTTWIKNLFNFYPSAVADGVTFDPRLKDDVIRVSKYLVVELGELDGTFRKSDMAALKGYITRDIDDVRRPYGAVESLLPRRTVFAASVNEITFLNDTTGNRRFWTIPVIARINYNHGFDMQQVWAEIYHGWLAGNKTYLNSDELSQLKLINEEHTPPDPITDRINTMLHWDNIARQHCTIDQIATKIGLKNITKTESNRIAKALRDRGLKCYQKKTKGYAVWGYDVP